MKARMILIAALLVAPVAVSLLPNAASAGTLRLVVLGDTDTTSAAQRNVDGALADGAQGMVGTGDYYYYSSASAWKTMFAPLTSKGAHLSIGNHDEQSQLASVFPEGTTWTRSLNGVRFVALNSMRDLDAGTTEYNKIRNYLCGATEDVKVLVMHHNWWLTSSAHHPGSEFPSTPATMDKLLTDCGVDVVFAGHEHNYQRMVRNGVQYVIVGTGGRSIYPLAGMPSGTVASFAGYGRLLIDVTPGGIAAQFKALDGSIKDRFTVGDASGQVSPTPTPTAPTSGGAVTFTPKGGNEWWVQVAVSGSPTKVEARDTNGAWVALSKKSWGDWAASFRVESGHDVQYRATTSSGVTESCWYDHPNPVCTSAPTTPTSPTAPTTTAYGFTPKGGNEWWVQVAVSGSPTKVEARDTNGAWVTLSKKSWGDWAASFRVEAGHTVQYRATGALGTSESCWYTHPGGSCT